uniref:Uncharacterized protein n=2 Tax=Candidatus Kentrum sp. FW TaxID=2126338 RepID=A0A450TJI8_9GAMM|nr:MAG: hypothetical protein BECKFW1821C_GA0114237_101228 [Candidatus Kentron sp. FW]
MKSSRAFTPDEVQAIKATFQKGKPNEELARLCLRPLIHHLFLPSLALGPGIPCRDDVRVVATSHVIPAGNAGT